MGPNTKVEKSMIAHIFKTPTHVHNYLHSHDIVTTARSINYATHTFEGFDGKHHKCFVIRGPAETDKIRGYEFERIIVNSLDDGIWWNSIKDDILNRVRVT